jgi:tetratricopeptide (TPR) repeat protein
MAAKLTPRMKDTDTIVQSKLNMAKVAIAQGRSKEALGILRPLLNSNGVTSSYLALRSAIAYAEAEVGTKDYAKAQRDLEQSLTATEKAGMRLDTARIYYLLGESARLGGSPDKSRASSYYGEAVRLLDTIRLDPGAENILHRADLKAIYDNANHLK